MTSKRALLPLLFINLLKNLAKKNGQKGHQDLLKKRQKKQKVKKGSKKDNLMYRAKQILIGNLFSKKI